MALAAAHHSKSSGKLLSQPQPCSSSRLAPQISSSSSRSSTAAHAARSDGPSSSDGFNPLQALQKELGMQSNKLDADIKERVEKAISKLGYRVTLSEAEQVLKALAYDSLGNLEVSQAGEVVYAFDRDFVAAAAVWKRAVNFGSYVARLAFGTALVVSALLVWLAVIAISSSRDDNRRDSSYGYGHRGFVIFDPTDFLLIWDPRYGRHSRQRVESGENMTFVEAVFSFVFGDGDPNMSFEERRWRALGAHIQRLGGVLEKYEDESFVLPALIRFNGEPFVDDEGRLLYKFPDLQVVANAPSVRLTAGEAKVPLERDWKFSEASPGQQAGALFLGLVNVAGIVTLSTMLADPISKLALYRQGLGFVLGLLPYLQTYAAAFFALPLIRLVVDGRRNAAIDERNDNRLEAVELLQSGDPDLAAKSASARKLGSTRVIGRQDIIYTTDNGTEEQVNAQEADEFDRRLGVNRRGLPPGGSGENRRVDDVFGRREQRLGQQQREAEKIEIDWGGNGRGSSSSRRGNGERRSRQRDEDWDRLDRW
ncbi:hypothetical protein COO60DRAFT_1674245 [Scenedesmus sp. NREL 46B-D3]|nr:hypothetical protein COO60DRAFT_1674245 [Scenedesmus sp. NREL 46B-D3]